MKIIKLYLLFIALSLVCISTNAQIFNGRYYTPIKSPYVWDFARFGTQLNVPRALLSSADSSAIGFLNGHFYGKYATGWKRLDSSATIIGSTAIINDNDYLIPDTINTVIFDFLSSVSELTLPSPSTSYNRTITVRNPSDKNVTTTYPIVFRSTDIRTTIAPLEWVEIKSNGTSWVVTKDSSGGGTIVPGGAVVGNLD